MIGSFLDDDDTIIPSISQQIGRKKKKLAAADAPTTPAPEKPALTVEQLYPMFTPVKTPSRGSRDSNFAFFEMARDMFARADGVKNRVSRTKKSMP